MPLSQSEVRWVLAVSTGSLNIDIMTVSLAYLYEYELHGLPYNVSVRVRPENHILANTILPSFAHHSR